MAFSSSTQSYKRTPTQQLFSSADDDENEGGIEDFESRRMDLVRSLQKTYYKSIDDEFADSALDSSELASGEATSSAGTPKLDHSTGRILNLPIWRVGWVEEPGRRNCLNVHEGKYTHMFEKILAQSSQSPLYFGHIYLPGGTAATKTGEDRYQLKSWREELEDETRFDIKTDKYNMDRSAVIGCLMQIVDYKRMEDGRLMILVDAVERFVVDEVVSLKPYAVANVQILLDEEELPWHRSDNTQKGNVDENFCKHLRGKAVDASFYYHSYEFDRPKLPVSDNRDTNADDDEKYLSTDDVPWVSISKLLPFAHYSSDDVSLDAANEKTASIYDSDVTMSEGFTRGELPLEQQLYGGGLLWNPPPIMSSNVVIRRAEDTTDCDALETLLWLALEDFCRATGFVLPAEVSCLIPPDMDYLDVTSASIPLSPKYPKARRQRRLSYLAPALIENLDVGKGMRQAWLNAPSTRARLLGVLERYDYLNNKLMGFE